jgi:hypothetical protein
MGEKIVVGPVNQGLKNNRLPFVIDNDSFPVLINAYQWRGRVKRKRGTSLLGRLRRYLGTTDGTGNITVTILPVPITAGIASFTIGTDIFVDPGGASPVTLLTNGSSVIKTLDRATGILTITGSQLNTEVVYIPTIPVMGLEDLVLGGNQFPGTLAFDTIYSYNINTIFPYSITDVSFFKNPPTGVFAGYVQKGAWTALWWNGQDYQQFWTTNYQGALWATNGINVPFSPTNIGMPFVLISNIVIGAVGPPATATITTSVSHGLVIGDFVFMNEVIGITGINFQTGYVTAVPAANQITVTFPNATLGGAYASGGIVQFLTNRSNAQQDCIRWYDGNPTNGLVPPTFIPGNGWVNFCPPLSHLDFSISDLSANQYYLVGARMIIPFKDRLLFLGPVVQASTGNAIYLQDTVIYSQNGTPYYTASFTGSEISADTTFNSILVPVNQTSTPGTFFGDVSGFGGFIQAGIDQQITTVSSNEDVLIIGFNNNIQTRFVYTGNDIIPFNFFIINSELGSSSTFSVINMDHGVITRGNRGFIITSQTNVQRIDLDIPDEVFQMSLINNGTERVCAQRDFINEWIYFTYPAKNIAWKFPNQTLQYNYRDDSWCIFRECYTTYGSFRRETGFTWATVGTVYPTWSSWNVPWNAGSSGLLQPEVIGGNQQGFVVFRDEGTDESDSLAIQNISGSIVTSPNHALNNGDYIIISGATGTVASQVNNIIFSVQSVTTSTFTLNPNIAGGTYLGGGVTKRLYVPFIQTKQFPVAWGISRKTRIGPQQYLLTTTDESQITLYIYLSQNSSNPYNTGSIIPNIASINRGLIYSTVLYTCTESSNLGLTPANTNLQMISLITASGTDASSPQEQIWHRINTSLIGDTVQLGFTMSDAQMRAIDENGNPINAIAEIELHGFILDVSPSQVLA